jgi:hypothetical protein
MVKQAIVIVHIICSQLIAPLLVCGSSVHTKRCSTESRIALLPAGSEAVTQQIAVEVHRAACGWTVQHSHIAAASSYCIGGS